MTKSLHVRALEKSYGLRNHRAGARAVDLGGPSVYQGKPTFEIKHKILCLQKRKLVTWGAKHVGWGSQAPPFGAGPACNRFHIPANPNLKSFVIFS